LWISKSRHNALTVPAIWDDDLEELVYVTWDYANPLIESGHLTLVKAYQESETTVYQYRLAPPA
jgi:hypothetical protein